VHVPFGLVPTLFNNEPFQQWGLGTDMMIGLGRAAGLLWAPVGISA